MSSAEVAVVAVLSAVSGAMLIYAVAYVWYVFIKWTLRN